MNRARWPPLLTILAAVAAPAVAQENGGGRTLNTTIEETLKAFTLYAAQFVEGAAALIIVIAVARALVSYFINLLARRGGTVPKDAIRLSLGRSLALALEFALGADILKTAVAPTWNEIGQLAAIAVLRTGLNYFLEKELRDAEARDPAASRHVEGTP
jgi:uncharacterized membrane protein